MMAGGEILVAQSRVKSLWTRAGLSALAATTAFLLHPSPWPAVWLGVYWLTVLADVALFARALTFTTQAQWQKAQNLLSASIVVTVLVFSSLSLYNWFLGGVEGKVFAAVSLCCSLMSVVLTLYYRKRYLYAALVPHALYLISLPITTMLMSGGRAALPLAIVVTGILAFLVYMIQAVKTIGGHMRELREAGEVARAAVEAAEAATAAKSNFLAVMTHEIRTPMNAVVSAVNLLRKTPLTEVQKSHLALMADANEVLLGLLNDVLDLSKIEAGKMTFERVPIALPEMLDTLEALFRPQAKEKGVQLKTILASDIDQQIYGDSLRLRQILFNLMSNAVKFTTVGNVWLRARRVCNGDSDMIVFAVEDEGIGIAPEALERIFNSFEQAELATTRRYGGTGLGLAISRKLARRMGGDITAKSVPGKGSCFTLTLPYEAVAIIPVIEPVVLPEIVEESSVHVLIVDDHEVNRRIVSLFLDPLGWSWTMAENGAEAVERCQTRQFDVILMDMQMPVLDGISATKQIRALRGPNQSTPIVALTANAMTYHRAAWAEVGVQDFLTKPIDPDLLVQTLMARAMPTEAIEEEILDEARSA